MRASPLREAEIVAIMGRVNRPDFHSHTRVTRRAWPDILPLVLGLCLLFALIFRSNAHAPSDTYLWLTLTGTNLTGEWRVAVRDLQHALGVDKLDFEATRLQELHLREEALAIDTLSGLKVLLDGQLLALTLTDQERQSRPNGDELLLRFRSEPWITKPLKFAVDAKVLFNLDPTLRCILHVQSWSKSVDSILDANSAGLSMTLSEPPSNGRQLLTFIWRGMEHIWTGYDHILFLIALLLPAVLRWHEQKWDGASAFRPVIVNVLKIVTAFTVAHSITLALASLKIVTLPTRWVESVIAASVILAAANNLIPLFRERSWMVAFGFGLVHGFGFASALTEAGLPTGGLVMALIGFNVGVEIGQLAIVSIFIPAAYQVRQTLGYRFLALRAGSVDVMLVAAVWMAERMFDFKVLPF